MLICLIICLCIPIVSSFPLNTPFFDGSDAAYASYSLRQINANYNGPVLTVRRSSDNAETDIGFGSDSWLDTETLLSFVGAGDGFVTTWYDQTNSHNLVNTDTERQPFIVRSGILQTTDNGLPAIYFEDDGTTGRTTSTYLSALDQSETIPADQFRLSGVLQKTAGGGEINYFGIDGRGRPHEGSWYRGQQTYLQGGNKRAGLEGSGLVESLYQSVIIRVGGTQAEVWQGNSLLRSLQDDPDLQNSGSRDSIHIGGSSWATGGFEGLISEFVVYASYGDASWPEEYYSNIAGVFETGPTEWNENVLLPQAYEYQVTFYDWLETITVQDVSLEPKEWSINVNEYDDDELADIWLDVESSTSSRVVRARPEWYVLDAGNGQGIEATGEVRIWHEPGAAYGGNPARSWANEPAHLYQLSIPNSDGTNGNPYYQDPALGRRALIVAMVDMMMYHQELDKGTAYATWQDMYGKAMSGWAETYLWTKDLLPPEVQDAYEEGMTFFLQQMIDEGPRAVNTNMDMFSIQGAAEFYTAIDNPEIQELALQAVRRSLFGYTDGELGVRHDVFKVGYDYGVYDPSGFIMEGDQPDIFYGGESLYQLTGALAAVTDRDTGEVIPGWEFLYEIVHDMEEWRLYQYFYEPSIASRCCGGFVEKKVYHAGAGLSGRTGAGVPAGQAAEIWKFATIVDYYPDLKHLIEQSALNRLSRGQMERDITEQLQHRTEEMAEVYEGQPPTWNGWSPWTKYNAYHPTKGWFSRMRTIREQNDPSLQPPVAREGFTYNKAFGGYPVGDQYWAYKEYDSLNRPWGFFVEAQGRQGGYGGWYGGKIETFWTDTTGVILLNRHGKTGCLFNDSEDSSCIDNAEWGGEDHIEWKAAHHVWGRDENNNLFSTILMRGDDLERPVTFDINSPKPTVSVTNIFNEDGISNLMSTKSGEQTGNELTGDFRITNSISALGNGVEVTHTVTSDGTDELNELWASIPVFLKLYNPAGIHDNPQTDLEDTSIEYLSGNQWIRMPEDTNGNNIPELVQTTALRLGRDFLLGEGPQYVYVGFQTPTQVRLASQPYYDPYQTVAGVRTVHFDMHGSPGTTRTLTESQLTYTITTERNIEQPTQLNIAPTAQLIDPTTDTQATTGQTVSLNAEASDSDGTIALLEILVDQQVIASTASNSLSFDWTAALGSHNVYARATDNEGATSTTQSVTIQVDDPAVINIEDDTTNFVVLTPNEVAQGENMVVNVDDTIVYNKGYYSVNAQDWVEFDLLGNAVSGDWIYGAASATITLPNDAATGSSNAVAVFTCSIAGINWNCHASSWQLELFRITN